MARKLGVTREQVVDAAAAIADRDGLKAVSLASVATVVGVRSPSLYAHVHGLGDLRRALTLRTLRLLAEAFLAAVREQEEPRAALRGIARSYRAFALAHPGLYASLLPVPQAESDPEVAAAAAELVRIIASVLDALGMSADRHVDFIRTLRALLHGFVDLELGGGFGLADPVDASFEAALDLALGSLDAAAPAEVAR